MPHQPFPLRRSHVVIHTPEGVTYRGQVVSAESYGIIISVGDHWLSAMTLIPWHRVVHVEVCPPGVRCEEPAA